jgi:hypothetical protein
MYHPGRFQRLRIPRRQLPFRQTRSEFQIPFKPASTSTNRKWRYILISVFVLIPGGAWLGLRQGRFEATSKRPIDRTIFHPFELLSKQNVSSTCSIFTLTNHTNNPYHNLYREVWREKKGVWSVQIKQPQLQIARLYSPLPPPLPHSSPLEERGLGAEGPDSASEAESTDLRFLIRHEPHGEVSGYLHNLPIGATVYVRGLNLEYELPDDIDEILFIAGGTGIVPAMQIAYSLFFQQRSASAPKMNILWANRRREDVLGGVSDNINRGSSHSQSKSSYWSSKLFWSTADQKLPIQQQEPSPSLVLHHHQDASIVREIENLKKNARGNLSIDYFVDEEKSYITPDLLKTYIANYEKAAPSRGRKLILISGPDGFVRYFAGRKIWMDGKESQGPLGGVLRGIDTTRWHVWKL